MGEMADKKKKAMGLQIKDTSSLSRFGTVPFT